MKILFQILAFFVVLVSPIMLAESNEKADLRKLIGTWSITNEASEDTYSGTTAEVTFYDGYMTIDSGRFAAAGIVSGAEDVFCHIPLDPILFKFIGDSVIYVTWIGEDRRDGKTFPQESLLTIVKKEHNRYTIIGEGGCGKVGSPRISYLERIE